MNEGKMVSQAQQEKYVFVRVCPTKCVLMRLGSDHQIVHRYKASGDITKLILNISDLI